MGDPRRVPGLSYNAGTCKSSGVSSSFPIILHLLIATSQFAPRPSGFQCPYAANIQSYCDANDEYCCSGTSAAVHNGYAPEYSSAALTFVKGKVNAMLGTKTTRSRIARDVAME
jgi:acetylxylan esterase